MTLDIAALREDTPGCASVLHLNNAGSSLQPVPVLEMVLDYIRREGEIGGYETADEYREYLDGIYPTIGRLIGGDPSGVALFQSATLAWDTAFYGMRLGDGDRILGLGGEGELVVPGVGRQGQEVKVVATLRCPAIEEGAMTPTVVGLEGKNSHQRSLPQLLSNGRTCSRSYLAKLEIETNIEARRAVGEPTHRQ